MIGGKIGITGWNSKISMEFRHLYSDCEMCERIEWKNSNFDPQRYKRYLLCHGLLIPKNSGSMSRIEIEKIFESNFYSFTKICSRIFDNNAKARVCIITSESAYRGSYNEAYSGSKLLLTKYIQKMKLEFPEQSLFGISPGIIEDAGMTTRRTDHYNLQRKRLAHRQKRFVTSAEIARVVDACLNTTFVSGTIVRMHGEND